MTRSTLQHPTARTASWIAAAAAVLALTAAPGTLAQPAGQGLGELDFPTSGTAEAQAHFLRGVKYLHSFEFDDAGDAFLAAQEADPDFAMAYWGEAMSYNHPLWAEQDVAAARRALSRLGATRADRLAKAPTDREKAYLAAIEGLYGTGDKLERDIAYSEAMGALHERYPDDDEAAAFYALSIMGTMRPGADNVRKQIAAGAIAQELFERNPNHPGAAHYVIHAFDDPVHAPLALRAADKYAAIAPAAGHALHMPSHIFLQRGLWDRAEASNIAAYEASLDWVERKGYSASRRDFHSLSWLHYVYLQQGKYDEARRTIDLVRPVAAESDAPRVQGALASMTARQIVETERWQTMALPDGDASNGYRGGTAVLLAAGMSAARTGDLQAADRVIAALEQRLAALDEQGRAYSANGTRIVHHQVAALTALARGDSDEARRLLDEAASLEATMDAPSGPPSPIKPSHELYGEVLLELEQPEAAMEQLEISLLRTPNRTRSVLGMARAAAAIGDTATARRYYRDAMRTLDESTPMRGRDEAMRFLSQSDQQ